jgi:hypothetical protein
MNLLQLLSITDIFSKVCPPDNTLMFRSISKKFKKTMNDMSLEVHIKIKSSDIDNIIKNIRDISKNYIITKIEFRKSYNIFMSINLDIICKLCPFLTHLDLGYNDYDVNKFCLKKLPKCNVIQKCFGFNRKIETGIKEYTFGKKYYYEYDWYHNNECFDYCKTFNIFGKTYYYEYEYEWYHNNECFDYCNMIFRPRLILSHSDWEKISQFRLSPEHKASIEHKILELARRPKDYKTKASTEHKALKKVAHRVKDYETKALNKRFHTNASKQRYTNTSKQSYRRYQKKY